LLATLAGFETETAQMNMNAPTNRRDRPKAVAGVSPEESPTSRLRCGRRARGFEVKIGPAGCRRDG
jgi:hypothetical protein